MAHVETFRDASARVVALLAAQGMVTASERLRRLERWAWPVFGRHLVTEVQPPQVTLALETCALAGRSRQSVVHLRNDISKVFAELIRDGVLEKNPARAEVVRTPKARRDDRKRALLTDAEYHELLAWPELAPQLRTMIVCARCFGGMRTSDLHAWRWEDVDLIGWGWADVPRPKTEHGQQRAVRRERIALPAEVASVLRAWWERTRQRSAGPVFRLQKHSYARDLRYALRQAGVLRAELHVATERTKPVDFHSFRRAFNTAVANAGLNMQQAMQLAGHRSAQTHMRYVLPEILTIPEAAVPKLQQSAKPDDPEALARELKRATDAGRWDVVAQLARELEARRVPQ
jgi:integrase